MNWRAIWELLKDTAEEWLSSETLTLGAALAYYSIFSIAPILVIALAIAGMVFGPQAAQGELTGQLEKAVGPAIAPAIVSTLRYTHQSGTGWWATTVGVIVLLVGAVGVFSQLQTSLNSIWAVAPKPGRGVWSVVKQRLLSFLMVLVMGGLLLLSLIVSTTLSALGSLVSLPELAGSIYLWRALEWAISLGLLTLLIAVIFKVLPDVEIDWGDVWVGAFVSAILFTLGSYLIGLYLGWSSVSSAYGAAGSLVVLLMWVYYSSQVFLFGAEFTRVYMNRHGRRIEPAHNAIRLGSPDRLSGAPAAASSQRH
jgi:membrane protein